MFDLRDYQVESVNYALNHGKELRPIHIAPCGSGKSLMQAFTAKRELDRGSATAILTPRVEIFDQTHGLVKEICGPENVSTLRAKRDGESWNSTRPIHIVSWPTLISRTKRSNFWFPKVDRVLVDEAHLSAAPKILEILEYYAPKAIIDGYTASPARQTGRGLGAFFTNLHHVTTVRQLTKSGHLAEMEYWGGSTPDLAGIKIRRGDYEVKKLSSACVELVGDVVDNWLRLASERHTIVFAVDIAHCEMLAHRFRQAGVRAASLHVRMDQAEREAVNVSFKSGHIRVLVNVAIASYGYDAPSVNCVVLARPTKSIVFHLQALGRGMRPNTDNEPTMVLDHAGNVRALGMADDLFRWRLDEGKKACENWTRDEKSGEAEQSKQHTCEECQYIFAGSRICPKCGWKVPFSKRDVAASEADLVPIGKVMVEKLPKGWPSHENFYRMLIRYGAEHGYKPGWATVKFKEKCGIWPPRHWMNMASMPVDMRVKNWLVSRNIAYAKAKQKADRQRTAGVSG